MKCCANRVFRGAGQRTSVVLLLYALSGTEVGALVVTVNAPCFGVVPGEGCIDGECEKKVNQKRRPKVTMTFVGDKLDCL